MKNYLEEVKPKQKVKKFQMGGGLPGPGGEPAAPAGPPAGPEAGGGIEQMLVEAYETQNPELALQVVSMIVEGMMGSQGGEAAPAGPQGMPMGRHGMKVPKISREVLSK